MTAVRQLDPMVVGAVTFSVDRCLARRGATMARPASGDLSSLASYWSAAAAIAGEDLALQVAAELPIGAFGLASYVIVSAQTLGHALETLGSHYLERLIPGMSLRVVAFDRAHVDLRLQSDGDDILMPLLEEIVLAVLHRHLGLLSVPATVHAAAFRRPAPASETASWRAFFGVTPRFRQRYSHLRLVASDLNIPLRTASPELQTIVRAAADQPQDTSLTARIRAYVRAHVREPIDAAAIARALDVTARTLQRKLQSEQTSLRELAAAVRIEAATEMLEHTETTIGEIAIAIGFTRPASFSRAFATATGETPQSYRRSRQRR